MRGSSRAALTGQTRTDRSPACPLDGSESVVASRRYRGARSLNRSRLSGRLRPAQALDDRSKWSGQIPDRSWVWCSQRTTEAKRRACRSRAWWFSWLASYGKNAISQGDTWLAHTEIPPVQSIHVPVRLPRLRSRDGIPEPNYGVVASNWGGWLDTRPLPAALLAYSAASARLSSFS